MEKSRVLLEKAMVALVFPYLILLTLASVQGQYYPPQPGANPYQGPPRPGPIGPSYPNSPGPYSPLPQPNYGGGPGQPYNNNNYRGPQFGPQGPQAPQGPQSPQGPINANFQPQQPQFTPAQTGNAGQPVGNRAQGGQGQTIGGQGQTQGGQTMAMGGQQQQQQPLGFQTRRSSISLAPVFGRSIVHPRLVSTYSRYFASFSLGGQDISAFLASVMMGASSDALSKSKGSSMSGDSLDDFKAGLSITDQRMAPPGQSSSNRLILNLLSITDGFSGNQQATTTNREVQDPNRLQVPPTNLSNCDPSPNFNIDDSAYLVTFSKPGCNPMTWMEAVDFCQKNQMVITSLGSSVDQLTVRKIMDIPTKFPGMPGFWIGGYVTHPDDKRVANTVTWTAMSRDADLVTPGQGIFSKAGESDEPQPDNWEFKNSTDKVPFKKEHCLAVLNNKYNDGLKVHDLACFRKLPVVCKELNLNPLGYLLNPLALSGLNN